MRSTPSATFRVFADSSRGYIEEANQLHAKRKYDEARETLRSGLVAFPEDPYLQHALAKRLRSTYKDDDEALALFAKAYAKRPDVFNFAQDYANFLHKKGDEKGEKLAEVILISLYDDEQPKNNKNIFVLTSLGNIYQQHGEYRRAAACFDGCLEIDENDEVALRRLREVENLYLRNKENPDIIDEVTDDDWDEFMDHAQRTITAAVNSGLWKEPPAIPPEPTQPK